jgi:hypothetical protein
VPAAKPSPRENAPVTAEEKAMEEHNRRLPLTRLS